ncbi:MAG: VCBS repeat-containing protein [Myxococcota bacterium]
MDWSRLDTRWWNLGVGLAATTTLAACGPSIVLEADSETDAIEDTDAPPNDTENTVPPPGPECTNITDCDPGFECIDNQCIPYDDYCSDGGCCDDGCCYGECYYYDCYSHEECGDGGLCNDFGECEYNELVPECADPPELLPMPLADSTADDVVGLAFVDANGDAADDLVVMHVSGSTIVHPGGAAAEPFELPLLQDNPVVTATSGDFNGDEVSDLAVADSSGRLTVLNGDGEGGFAIGYELDIVQLAHQIEALDWNGDGVLDLAIRMEDSQVAVLLGDGTGALVEPVLLEATSIVRDFATGHLDGDDFDDVVLHDEADMYAFLGNDEGAMDRGGIVSEPQYNGPRYVLTSDFDGSGVDEIFAHTALGGPSGWVLVEAYRDGSALPPQAIDGTADHAASGDIDGDGTPDVVFVSAESVVFARGNAASGDAPVIDCAAYYQTVIETPLLAVGDFDGSGRDEIAVGGQGSVLILSNL